MSMIRLRYIQRYHDRHGKLRHYLRRPGCPAIALPGLPGTPEFMEAYAAGMSGSPPPRPSRFGVGSFGALVTEFCRSIAFANLKPSSQATYRLALGPLIAEHGHRSVLGMDRERVEKIITAIGATRPGMANLTRAVLHRIMRHAVKHRWRPDNPVAGIEPFRTGTRHTWTDAELAAYETRWPLGTRERLAYALLLYTDQRGGDVVRMQRHDIRDGAIHLVQDKTGLALAIPIHAALDRAMKAGPKKGVYLIGDKDGRPIRRAALTALVKRAAKAAGLPARCLPHGLRKALQRLLAEHGATAKELQAVAGHATLKESERYTREADQAHLARAAMAKLPDRK